MIQFENILHLSILSDSPKREYDIYTEEFSLSPKSEQSKNGIIYSLEENIIIEKIDPELRRRLSANRRASIRFIDTSGASLVIGDRHYPCIVHIEANMNRDILNIKLKSANQIMK